MYRASARKRGLEIQDFGRFCSYVSISLRTSKLSLNKPISRAGEVGPNLGVNVGRRLRFLRLRNASSDIF